MRLPKARIQLDRTSGIPLYIQIKEELRRLMNTLPDERELVLPPQRELAEDLHVSRNTVSMAYAELEREGLVASHVGKGTVIVGPAKRLESRNLRERLARAIEHAGEEALSMGFTLEQFAEAVDGFLRERKRRLRNIRVVFVECNREQLEYFSKHLELDPGVTVLPMLLSNIQKNPEAMLKKLSSADLVVTSFYHIEELEQLMPEDTVPLVGVNLQPEMSTIVKLARIPNGARVGLVAASKRFIAEIRDTLDQVHMEDSQLKDFVGAGGEELKAFIEGVDALVVSPSRRREVEMLADGRPVAEFVFAPDKGSVNNIRISLFELKQQRKREAEDAGADIGTDLS